MRAPTLASMARRETSEGGPQPAVAGAEPSSAKLGGLMASDQGDLASTGREGASAMSDFPSAVKRPPSWELSQLTLRMSAEKHRKLKQLAAGLDKTIQEVLTEALDLYLENRGMRKID